MGAISKKQIRRRRQFNSEPGVAGSLKPSTGVLALDSRLEQSGDADDWFSSLATSTRDESADDWDRRLAAVRIEEMQDLAQPAVARLERHVRDWCRKNGQVPSVHLPQAAAHFAVAGECVLALLTCGIAESSRKQMLREQSIGLAMTLQLASDPDGLIASMRQILNAIRPMGSDQLRELFGISEQEAET